MDDNVTKAYLDKHLSIKNNDLDERTLTAIADLTVANISGREIQENFEASMINLTSLNPLIR